MVAQPLLPLAAPITANQLLSYVSSLVPFGDAAACGKIRAYSLALDFKALARTRDESRRCQSVSCGFIVTHSDFRVSPPA